MCPSRSSNFKNLCDKTRHVNPVIEFCFMCCRRYFRALLCYRTFIPLPIQLLQMPWRWTLFLSCRLLQRNCLAWGYRGTHREMHSLLHRLTFLSGWLGRYRVLLVSPATTTVSLCRVALETLIGTGLDSQGPAMFVLLTRGVQVVQKLPQGFFSAQGSDT